MNHPVFLRTLRSQNIFKISDKLKAFDVKPLPNKKIILKQFQCKKTNKTLPPKQPNQTYLLTTISDQAFAASQKASTFTLAEREFLQGGFLKSVMGQMSEVSSQEYVVSGFQWDGFVLQFVSFSQDLFLFIITNQMISPLVRKPEGKDIQFKIKQGFQELISRIINQKKATQLIQIYIEELKKLFDKHPELLTLTEDDDKLINFNLIKYAKITEISSQQNQR